MTLFDYERMAVEAAIPEEALKQIGELVRKEFPRDEMMWELHMLRVCMAIRDRHVSLETILAAGSPAVA